MSIGYFLSILDTMEKDLLRVVEVSRKQRKMLRDFNATFISLIPKKDDTNCLDDYNPISLCDNIYKMVANILANRIKGYYQLILLTNIFSFL